jgi:citrate lyase beta subunit
MSVIVEEVEALGRIDEVLGSHERVEAVSVGFGDFAASRNVRIETIGGTADYPGDVWHYARARTVAAARAAGVAAYEGPYADYSDPEGLREACCRSRALGFDGKGAIHPAQLPIINEVFGEQGLDSADHPASTWRVELLTSTALRRRHPAIAVNARPNELTSAIAPITVGPVAPMLM